MKVTDLKLSPFSSSVPYGKTINHVYCKYIDLIADFYFTALCIAVLCPSWVGELGGCFFISLRLFDRLSRWRFGAEP
jgi:hypothetical protein